MTCQVNRSRVYRLEFRDAPSSRGDYAATDRSALTSLMSKL